MTPTFKEKRNLKYIEVHNWRKLKIIEEQNILVWNVDKVYWYKE